jgi:YD repeat-containing protein
MTVDPLGRVERFAYDSQSRLLEESYADLTVRNRHDERGNLIGSTDPLGQEVGFAYDPLLSRLESFRDPNGNVTGYVRDDQGNLRTILYADATAEQFTYDAQGLPITGTTRRAQTTTNTYNTRGQLTRRDHTDGTHEDYVYDARGNLAQAIGGDHAAGVPGPQPPGPADAHHLPVRPVPGVQLPERPPHPHGRPGRLRGAHHLRRRREARELD